MSKGHLCGQQRGLKLKFIKVKNSQSVSVMWWKPHSFNFCWFHNNSFFIFFITMCYIENQSHRPWAELQLEMKLLQGCSTWDIWEIVYLCSNFYVIVWSGYSMLQLILFVKYWYFYHIYFENSAFMLLKFLFVSGLAELFPILWWHTNSWRMWDMWCKLWFFSQWSRCCRTLGSNYSLADAASWLYCGWWHIEWTPLFSFGCCTLTSELFCLFIKECYNRLLEEFGREI